MSRSSTLLAPRWNIFCRVVDNFGDIGVCLRLARMLSRDYGRFVRLWVDDWTALRRLCPLIPESVSKTAYDGVEFRPWAAPFDVVGQDDVVIEAFACELPQEVIETMARCSPSPLWINLEYLSAEAWVDDCHRMRSPHPRLPLVKHFFFPGFTPATAGILREPSLFAARDELQADEEARRRALSALVGRELPRSAYFVSLFAYEQPALSGLMRCWSEADRPMVLLVPEGRVVADVALALGCDGLSAGSSHSVGALSVVVLPFSDQDAYDRLLWACDLNFVRGEDSFVRAQWAARPFVWQIYPQPDDAHRAKLDAFLSRYVPGLGSSAADALQTFWRAWNGDGDPAQSWAAFASFLPELGAHCRDWADLLAVQNELARELVDFSETGV